MKNSSRWISGSVIAAMGGALVAAAIFVSPSLGQQAPSTQPMGGRGRGRGPSLGSDMRGMDQAFTKIRAQYSDPAQNDSTLSLLSTFESQAALAKGAIPPTINGMADADKKKAIDEYRSMLRDLVRTSLDLEDEIMAGDMDKATASIAKMADIEKSGHAEFRPKEN